MSEQSDVVEIREVLAAMHLGDVDLMDDVFLPDAMIDYTAIGGSVAPWTETKPWLQGMIAVELVMLLVGDVYVTFDAVIDHMAAGRYPIDGWVERVPWEDQLSVCPRLDDGEAIKLLIDL